MTPVNQDKFNHTFKYGGGNCLQACVASLLDLPLEAVPHFMLFGRSWGKAFRLFLRTNGFENAEYIEGLPPSDDKYRIGILEEDKTDWSHAVILKGSEIVHDPHPTEKNMMPLAGFYILI